MKAQQFSELTASIEELTFAQKKRLFNLLKQSTCTAENIEIIEEAFEKSQN